MKRPTFANGHIYHIYNRGVEKRNTFLKEKDYLRFVSGLYAFNDSSPALNMGYFINRQPIEVRLQYERDRRRNPRNPLVEVLAFCLLPNHYHLMLRQRIENGITEFMRKLGTGYTNFFNLKYVRVGPLFQGKFKAILIEREEHFLHLPHYIHLNPLDLIAPAWREGSVGDIRKALDFLRTYRWSSLPDYLGRKNFPSVIDGGFLRECIGGPKDFQQQLLEWLRGVSSEIFQEISLE